MTQISKKSIQPTLYTFYWMNAVIIFGFFLAILYHHILELKFGYHFPWNTYLFRPEYRFSDWTDTLNAAKTLNPYFDYNIERAIPTYFPFTYLLLSWLPILTDPESLYVFFAITILLYTAGFILYAQKIAFTYKSNNFEFIQLFLSMFLFMLFSYPFQFAVDRGNLDLWIHPLCLIYLALYKSKSHFIGSFALGIAIAFKGYPAAFCLLSMKKKYWKKGLLPFIIALFLSLIALHSLGSGFNQNLFGLKQVLQIFKQKYLIGNGSMHYFTDPYNMIKLIPYTFPNLLEKFEVSSFLSKYIYFSFICASALSLFSLFSHTDYWKKLTAICCLILLFPSASNDYKLLCLIPPFLEYMSHPYRNSSKIFHGLIRGSFLFLFIPKHYYYFFNSYSISGYLSPLALLFLAISTLSSKKDWKSVYINLESIFYKKNNPNKKFKLS